VGASPLFESDDVLSISLTGPLSSLVKDKENRVEWPFVLRANGVEHQIKLRVRGKSRIRVCNFPPLRLNFSKSDTAQSVFAGQNKLKLVTDCEIGVSSQANTLEEYAAYKIFNLISDVSYRVRLVRVSYRDTDKHENKEPIVRYNFLIEAASELAQRVGGEPVHVPGVMLSSLDKHQAASVYVFQYLIGNTDWSLATGDGDDSCCHNGDLFDIDSRHFIVPFDFDLSGLVNAKYARPDPSFRISKVTRRLYRGYCISPEALMDAIRAIAGVKSDILAVMGQVPGLPDRNVKRNEQYLDKFFAQANDVEKLEQSFERKCL
jgi:hypothetical protein